MIRGEISRMPPSCESRRPFGARWATRAALIAAIAIGSLAASPGIASAVTITVNSTADTATEDAVCTLREAITSAATDTESGDEVGGVPECIAGLGLDTIEFSIAGSAPHVISPLSPLPNVDDETTIDGLSDPDSIEIDGVGAASATNGLVLAGGGNTVRGLSVYRFPGHGILGAPVGAVGTIEDSFIGTDSAGTDELGNGLNGIHNFFIDELLIQRNVISGNGASGSGNGVVIGGSNIDDAVIRDNKIGTNPVGTVALSNSGSGILLSSPGNNHQIGGPAVDDGNVISGNTGTGVWVTTGVPDSGGNDIRIEGNLIGTNAAGTVSRPNSTGVALNGPLNDATVRDNVISGNGSRAVHITNSTALVGPTGVVVAGNKIGVDASGAGPLGNGREGVRIEDNATGNRIGGTASADANVIANNGVADIGEDDGVVLVDAAAVENAVLGNSIHSNGDEAGDLGIDLAADGVTANDAGDGDAGANGKQNFPLLSSAFTGSSTTISGTLDSAANTDYRVEFFSSPAPDPSGNGEGQTLLGATSVKTNGSGDASFSATVAPTVATGEAVTATATRLVAAVPKDTSEFSASVAAVPAPPEPPSADTTAPIITLAGKKTQRSAKRVTVKVTLNEDAALTAKGNIKVPKVNGARSSSVSIAAKKKKFKLKGTDAEAQASTTLTLKVKLTNKAKKKTKAALKKGKTSTAKVTITARDAAGNESSAKRKIKVKPKK